MKSVRSILFGLTLVVSLLASVSNAQYMTSAYSCNAHTVCLDGYGNIIGQISCQVYGHQYVSGYGISSNSSCTWGVVPYQSVQCTGFQQVYDQWGRTVWAWQTSAFQCPY